MNIQPNDTEQKTFDAWYSEHIKTCYKDHNQINLKIVCSGIGNMFVVQCPICNVEKDITDYTCW
jgi:hypothetical protein